MSMLTPADAQALAAMGTGGLARVTQMLAEMSTAELESIGIAPEDWARLPGELRDQVLQAAGDQRPEEYRTLIKLYFQEVARRAGRSPKAAPPAAPAQEPTP